MISNSLMLSKSDNEIKYLKIALSQYQDKLEIYQGREENSILELMAIPIMEKAHEINPKDKYIFESFSGTIFSSKND